MSQHETDSRHAQIRRSLPRHRAPHPPRDVIGRTVSVALYSHFPKKEKSKIIVKRHETARGRSRYLKLEVRVASRMGIAIVILIDYDPKFDRLPSIHGPGANLALEAPVQYQTPADCNEWYIDDDSRRLRLNFGDRLSIIDSQSFPENQLQFSCGSPISKSDSSFQVA